MYNGCFGKDIYGFYSGTTVKCIVSDAYYVFMYGYVSKAGAFCKCIISYIGHIFRYCICFFILSRRIAYKRFAVFAEKYAVYRFIVWIDFIYIDSGKLFALPKCTFFNTCYAFWYSYACNNITAIECVTANACHAIRYFGIFYAVTMLIPRDILIATIVSHCSDAINF